MLTNSLRAKARQAAKLSALRHSLIDEGYCALDEQSAVLGLRRSTTWTILAGRHKSTGLSAAVINRMLASPSLPQKVRAVVIEYVEERVAGLYGHSHHRIKAFSERLQLNRLNGTTRARASGTAVCGTGA